VTASAYLAEVTRAMAECDESRLRTILNLRMTHFCAAQNQPRLKATAFGPDSSGITFSFVDITNLSSPKAGHVQGLDMKFLAADHITLQFHFVSDGNVRDELLDLKRKK
jgi:hypothetical protein